ncbi:SOS response-associated peptidase [Dyadobacter sp. CY327]|uniref:SOS response-associated peptidase n=1 Tax=Dyadobacter sp. CY327 TaxID=2907301 RepID=UPI001F1C3470|nr:SOS response-associated peptidase family protein [Dyadobacter sp. CY327]MCE7072623.1 SOS response-associated peptidase [Dyadobacter sp. CY327]
MCYHVSNESDVETLKAEFKLPVDKLEQFKKRYDFNGFEKPFLPVMTSPKSLDLFRWRLVPPNIDDETTFRFNTLNATNYDLFNRDKMWSKYAKHNRCLVLCSGFFEHHYPDLNNKKNYESWYIKPREKKFFAMGAIYSTWKGTNTFSIVTQEASPMIGAIHNDGKRQPLILKGDAALSWMIPSLIENEIMDLTYFQYPEDKLSAYRVIDGVYSNQIDTNLPQVLDPYGQLAKKAA